MYVHVCIDKGVGDAASGRPSKLALYHAGTEARLERRHGGEA